MASFLLRPAHYLFYYYSDPIILEFALGLCVGALYTHGPKIALWIGLVAIPIGMIGIIASGVAGLVNDHHVRFYAIGVPASLIVFGVTIAKGHQIDPKPALLVALGDASYSIYLTHVVVIPIGARVWATLPHGNSMFAVVLFGTVQILAVAVVGWLIHRLIERPLVDWLMAFVKKPSSSAKSS